ncbi:dTDP-4-dehydrorhamnose reductase [Anoxybacillus thermarum]|uniref:dTDP-4-dehydrorhamnose reductase n=1 Tax=Anoxybacillus thermarum TaxID=404937 RepID=A0A0D0S0M2_9BACL|nr:dTDP-4-dehydrorhamnose reductase [Anoxybacillus thermarum]KIQ95155.1 dTDP-4-dehydrorhamnose reductase [Anoxybacillus thermarum]
MRSERVVVTGAKGQLGTEAVKQLRQFGWDVYGYGKDELDVTDDRQVKDVFTNIRPHVVIHAAAYTKVDEAEKEKERAFLINAYGTRNVAVAAEKVGAKLVYISTDYVFDGRGKEPYDEFASPHPINIYGKSKLAGEQFVRDFHSKFFIVRTSWVFGANGNNFVKTMLQLAKEKKEIFVVGDQYGCPTYAVDLAQKICELVETEKYGLYHISNTDYCSWYEFAEAIFAQIRADVRIQRCRTEDYPRLASRPAYSVLNHMALKLNGFTLLRPWHEALQYFLSADEVKR